MGMTLLSFLEERMGFGNRMGLLGPNFYCLRNTGNRKLPPFHFLEQTTKELFFFLHGNKLMQSRCREAQRWCLPHRSRLGFICQRLLSLSALTQTGILSGTTGVGTFALINNNKCVRLFCHCQKHTSLTNSDRFRTHLNTTYCVPSK